MDINDTCHYAEAFQCFHQSVGVLLHLGFRFLSIKLVGGLFQQFHGRENIFSGSGDIFCDLVLDILSCGLGHIKIFIIADLVGSKGRAFLVVALENGSRLCGAV